VIAFSTPLLLCPRRVCAWAAAPAVLRFYIFSLMGFLLLLLLTLLPLFVGAFALWPVGFCNTMPLSKESNRRANPLVEVFLVDFDPVNVPGLFANFDPFENVLLVGFESGQIL
jgi:hypothetical protein